MVKLLQMSRLTGSNSSHRSKLNSHLQRISESEYFMKSDDEEANNNVLKDGFDSSETKEHRVLIEDKNIEVLKPEHSLWVRIAAALFYVITSSVITMANKVVLTSFQFPSFQALALGQIGTAIVVLFCAKELDLIEFPMSKMAILKIFPLPILFMGNVYSGLGGTKAVSLPMLSALRKFSILFTIIAEIIVLGSRPSLKMQGAVFTMISGALIASARDLSFSFYGYFMVTLNNLFTASNGVYIKKKLDTTNFGKYGLLFYNSIVVILPGLIIAELSGEIEKTVLFTNWDNYEFLTAFLASCFLGFVLNISIVFCTHVNSALTTLVVGSLKDILITYGGMFVGGDYIFHWINFLGLNICTAGSLYYTYIVFLTKSGGKSSQGAPKTSSIK